MGLTDVFQAIQKKFSFSKVVEISGIKFELSILSFDQELKSESFPQGDADPLAYYNETRRYTLSHAIRSIDGEVVPEVVEIKNGSKIEKIQGSLYVKGVLSKLPVKIVEQLFDAYIDIKEEYEGMLDKELKYDWFKTPEQRDAERKSKTEEKSDSEEPKSEDSAQATEEAPINFVEIPKPVDDAEKV